MAAKPTPRTSAGLVALLALAAAGIARADNPRVEARAHYAKGLELGAQNGYAGALREFEQAYALSPQYAVLYNIGQAHLALGHTAEAIDVLGRYLRDGGDRIAPLRRAQVERQLAELRARLNPEQVSEAEAARATGAAAGAAAGEAVAAASEGSRASTARPGTLTVRCSEPGLKLALDGKGIDLAASSRGIPLPGGVHQLILTAPGRRSTEQRLEIAEGGAAIVICEVLPTATPARAIVPVQPIGVGAPVFAGVTGSPETPTIHAKTIAYVLGGLGVTLGGTAIGVYFWNRSQYADAQNEQTKVKAHPTDYDLAVKYNADVDALHQTSILTVGLAVTSIGLFAGGAYLYLHERNRDARSGRSDTSRSWASVTPGGLFWNGVW